MIYNDQQNYGTWEFIFDPAKQKPLANPEWRRHRDTGVAVGIADRGRRRTRSARPPDQSVRDDSLRRRKPVRNSAAAAAPEAVGRQSASPSPFRRADLPLVHPEIVRHLVPDRVLHKAREVLRTPREALVGTLEDRDPVGHGERLENAALGQRTALIQPEQSAAMGHAAAAKLRRIRLILHQQCDILHPAAESGGDPRPGVGDQPVEALRRVVGRHALPVILISWPNPNLDALSSPSTAPRARARAPSPDGLPNRLGFTYIDTGAMYRAVALWARAAERRAPTICIAWSNSPLAAEIELDAGPHPRSTARTSPTPSARPRSRTAPRKIAVIPGVRRAMVAKQREMGERTSVVMEGRDIGTVVFPDAARENLPRRQSAASACAGASQECAPRASRSRKRTLAAQMKERDQRDSTRADAPLAQAPDAIYLDSTGMSIEEVEEAILKIVRARVTNGKEFS